MPRIRPNNSYVTYRKLYGDTGVITIGPHMNSGNRLYIRSARDLALDCNETWDLIEKLTIHAERLWEND